MVMQKLRVIKEVISNKVMYQLQLSDHGLEEVHKIDRIINAKVKEILHLPSWTSTNWIHSKEGLGLTGMQSMVMIARKKANEKMLLSEDQSSKTIATQIDPLNSERLGGLRLHHLQPNQRKVE